MAFKKGKEKTGGREKGTPNKDSLNLEERAKERGVDVFNVALDFASGNWKALGYDNECYVMENPSGATKIGYTITPEMRLKAIEFLMKYIYTQKKAVELSSDAKGFEIVIKDYGSRKT